MRKTLFLLMVALMCTAAWGCDYKPASSSEIDIDAPSTISEEKEDSSSENSEVDMAVIKKTYGFLISPYTVTSKRETFGTYYECDYFFLDGVVVGIHATTTLPDEETAEAYYDTILKSDPYATVKDCTVTYYSHSEDFYFDGYTPEKLKFALEKAGYEVKINFDLVKFNSFYNKEANDKKE